MKTKLILIHLLYALGASLVASAPLRAEPMVDATQQACAARTYAGSVPQIQIDLNRIYAADPEFKKDVGEGANPLRDGLLGPITRKWLGLFCKQHPFKARESSFEADVVVELSRFRPAAAVAPTLPAEPPTGVNVTYRYDPKVLRQPKDVEMLLPRLRLLTDRYSDKQLFDEAVRRALKGLVVDAETLARIEAFAAVDGYMLPSDQLKQLKGASPALLEKLMLKSDTDYASADDFHLDLEIAMGEGPEKAELAKYAARIDQLARVIHYRIPATIAADLSAATALEPPVAALYLDLANIEYPSKELLNKAFEARLLRALNMCKANRYRHEGVLADPDVKVLWALVESGGQDIDRIMRLRKLEHRCSNAELAESDLLIRKGHTELFGKLGKAADLMKVNKALTLSGQGGPVAADGCGCGHDGRNGMTYGFYPLWADATEKKLDFDVMSRIGLYGMTIDDQGGLQFPAGVNTRPWKMLESAHRHMTKVDWVLYKSDWDGAKRAGMAGFLVKLRQSVGHWMRRPFPHRDWNGTALATFGLEQGPSTGDGIVLRFANYPTGSEYREPLREFVQALSKELRDMTPSRQLFLMVAQADIIGPNPGEAGNDDRPFSTVNLHALIQQANPIFEGVPPASSKRQREDDVKLLVLIQEPASREKVALRADIEKALFTSHRVRMLRNVIPVVEYDGERNEQLRDEIVYFQDNFGGIGFWPLPFATDSDNVAGSNTVNQVLHAYFHVAGLDGGLLAEWIDLICPNRTWLRWLAWVSSILAIVAGVTLARCRGCGTRLDSNAFYMASMVALIVLPFVVIAALMVGDPLFQSESGVHWIVAAVLIAVVVIPGAYGLLKPARKLP